MLGLGCRQKRPAPSPGPGAKEVNEVLATIDGLPITSKEVDPVVEQWMAGFADRLAQWTPEYVEQRRKDKRRQVLDQLIAERLLDQEAQREQIAISDQQVDQAIAQMAAQQQPPMTTEQFLRHVEHSGRSIEDLRGQIRQQLARQALCEKVTAAVEVTDQQAMAYYQANMAQFYEPEQVRASHILLRPSQDASDPNQQLATVLAKAQQLLAQINAGADFAELARTSSQCPSAANGGDLGYFKKGEMEAPFEKLAFELAPGQVGGPVVTSYGVHIIKVTDHKPAQQLTFEQAKDRIIETLKAQQKEQLLRDFVQSLRAKARVEYKVR
jgi:peptidyl-prolyl cis-trans isomerase C